MTCTLEWEKVSFTFFLCAFLWGIWRALSLFSTVKFPISSPTVQRILFLVLLVAVFWTIPLNYSLKVWFPELDIVLKVGSEQKRIKIKELFTAIGKCVMLTQSKIAFIFFWRPYHSADLPSIWNELLFQDSVTKSPSYLFAFDFCSLRENVCIFLCKISEAGLRPKKPLPTLWFQGMDSIWYY